MLCTLEELRDKEVIDSLTGERLGFIDDVRLDTETAQIQGFIIYGRYRLFGLFGREADIVLSCGDITVIGSDVILVNSGSTAVSPKSSGKRRGSLFD